MQIFSSRCSSQMRLDGKTVIITGCNTGIGKETARDFYERGGRIIMACRNIQKGKEAKTDIKKSTSDKKNLGVLISKKLDLNSLNSVKEFADDILRTEEQIHILINNAGVMICPQGQTEDGFETQFGTNHLGHFLLTLLLLPAIVKSAPARIVNVSAKAHFYGTGKIDFEDPNYKKRRYGPIEAYAQSKLANVMFSKELDRRLKESGIRNVNCYSLHPGVIATDLSRHIDAHLFRGSNYYLFKPLARLFCKTPVQGSQTTIHCAIDEKCEKESGLYYSECKVTKPLAEAENEESCKKLWDLSLKLVNLNDKNLFTTK